MEKYLQQEKSNCLKVVLFGPESTGKSSLAKELADHYNTFYVDEFARNYLQKKWNKYQLACELKDIIPIAEALIINKIYTMDLDSLFQANERYPKKN